MQKRRFQHPLHKQQDVLCAIGDVVVSFALLEHALDALIALSDPARKPGILTAKDLVSADSTINPKIETLRKRNQCCSEDIVPAELLDRIVELANKRNRVIHDVYLASSPGTVAQWRSGKKFETRSVPLDHLNDLATQAQEAAYGVQQRIIACFRRGSTSKST